MTKRLLVLLCVLLALPASAATSNIRFLTLSGVQTTGAPSDTISPDFVEVGVGTVTLSDDGSGNLTTSGSIVTTIPNDEILIGSGSNVGVAQALTGDVTMTNLGVTTISASAVVDSKVSASAAIQRSKLAVGDDNYVVINSSGGVLTDEAQLAVSRGGTNSGTALNNDRIMISLGGAIVEQSAIMASSALASDSNGLPVASSASATQLGYLSTTTSDVQVQLNGKLSNTGGSESGNITMTGGATVTGLPTPVNTSDAVPKTYVDSLISGLTWLDPIQDSNLINDSLNTPPGSPTVGETYIVGSAPTGAWVAIGAGHATWWNGTAWVDLLGRAVVAGDRFGVTFQFGSGSEGGGLASKHNDIAQIVSPTASAETYTFTAAANNQAVFVNQENSYEFGNAYVYQSSLTTWVEFAGPSASPVTNPLYYTGNTLNFAYDNSTLNLNGSNQLEVASGGITNTQVNSAAAIAFSKLAALPSADILVGSVGNVATAVSMTGDVSITNTGATTVSAVGGSTAANVHSAELLANAATNVDTNSAIVRRDGSGNIAVSQLTATSITGLTTPLSVGQGGTGDNTFATNGILFGNTASALQVTAAGTQYQVLQAGSGGVPAFGALNLSQSAAITGTLPIGNGGTGQITKTAAFDGLAPTTTTGDISYFNGTNNVRLAVGATGTVLHGGTNPTYSQVNLTSATDVTGVLPTANGGTGQNSTAVFPTSGNVLTDVNTFTVTNKTISATSNTLHNIMAEYDFSGTGSQTAFTLGQATTATSFLFVYVDGRLQQGGGTDYSFTVASPGVVTFGAAPDSGSWVDVTVVNQ